MVDFMAESGELADLRANFNFVQEALTSADSDKAATRENAARHAFAEMSYVSTGVGQQRVGKAMRFPIVFRESPQVATASATIKLPDPKLWHDPVGTGGVYAWLRDGNGNYIGAKIWVRVDIHPVDDSSTETPPAKVSTKHYFTFSGMAIKSVPTSGVDNAVTPRTVDILTQQKITLAQLQAILDAAND
jgi:hypothetical protein